MPICRCLSLLSYYSQKTIIHSILERKPMPKKVAQLAELSDLGSEYYEVEKILAKRITSKGEEYLIQWKHYPNPRDYTWEPIEHLQEVQELVDQFNKDFELKNKKKEKNGQKKKEEEEEIEERILEVNSDEPEEVDGKSHEQPEKSSRVGRKKRAPKAPEEQARYMPKVIEMPFPKKREKMAKALKSDEEGPPAQKRKVKDEEGRPMAMVILNSDESSPANQDSWFTRAPFRLGTIFRHFFSGPFVYYIVNVQNLEGQLITTVCLRDQEIQKIDRPKVQAYILNYLCELSRQYNEDQFQEFWRE